MRSASAAPSLSIRADQSWWPFAAIAAPFAIGWLLVAPWHDVPVIDDWAYAWSVEHLLKTGHLVISDRSSIYPIVQILWGALFARLDGGFSFGILRLSTVVLAVVGCWALFLTLRELGCGQVVSLIGALTLAVYPAYFVLSFTFMTDVPFVALSIVAAYFYVAGVHRERAALLWWGSAFALLAFLVRQVGIVLPVATLAAANRSVFARGTIRRFWLPILAGVVAIVAVWLALPHLLGGLPVIHRREENAHAFTLLPAGDYLSWNIELVCIVAFPWATMLVCPLLWWRRLLVAAGIAALLLVFAWVVLGNIPTPLASENTWAPQDLAMRSNLIGGDLPASAWLERLMPLVKILGALMVASLIAGIPRLRQTDWRAGRILIAFALLNVLVINVLWVYYDRYYLILAPAAAYVAAGGMLDARVRRWPAWGLLALWAALAIPGTRAVLATNALVEDMTRELEQQGVPPFDIDAGYTSNAWRLYSHPENLPPGADPHTDVPSVSDEIETKYAIVTQPAPSDEILKTADLPSAWWQLKGHVYTVRRRSS